MNARHWWRCADCGSKHSSYSDAMTCCAPDPEPVYCCSTCYSDFETEDAAEACCCEVEDESITVDGENLPFISAEELEAAGQLRLPLPEVVL